ncbi:MAG: GNAT family N-acetyltransferase [Planctomycetota bacterium]
MAPPVRSGPLTVRCYERGDEVGILQLFHRVFGDDGVKRSLESWRWQYQECPAGRQVVVGVDEDSGRIVSQYAAIPVRFTVAGEECIFAQAVDSMVDPNWRRSHSCCNAFLATARRYFELCPTDPHYRVCYGFPNRQALVVGCRHLRYSPTVRPVPTLFLNLFESAALSNGVADEPDSVCIEPCESFGSFADALWDRLRSEYPMSAVRDSVFLDWRFAGAPVPYLCHRVVDAASGEPRGLFVLREGWRSPNILAVAEIFLAPGDRDALRAVLTTALRVARSGDFTRIEMWLPRRHPNFRLARELGMRVESSLMTCVSRCFRWSESSRWSLRNCYYTMADCDVL